MRKTCLACGVEKYRTAYRGGSDVCRKCTYAKTSGEILEESLDLTGIDPAMIEAYMKVANLAVNRFRPQKHQAEFWHDFFDPSGPRIMLISGGNRSGKSMATAAAVAKYSLDYANKNVVVATSTVALLAQNTYTKLFKKGAFKYDDGKMSDLLLPDTFRAEGVSKGIGYVNKAKREWHSCELKNGTDIKALSFSSDAQDRWSGWEADLIWLDELPTKDGLLGEIMPRLTDRNGRLIISATYVAEVSDEWAKLREDIEDGKYPEAKIYIWDFMDREDLTAKAKKRAIELLPPEERAARAHGAMMVRHGLIFPDFRQCIIKEEDVEFIQIKDDGSRLLDPHIIPSIAIDPGAKRCAVTLTGYDIKTGHKYILAEYKETQQTPRTLAKAVWRLLRAYNIPHHTEALHRVVCDYGGTNTSMLGSVRSELTKEFQLLNINARLTGHSTQNPRKANKTDRISKVRQDMHLGKLFILSHCKKLIKELTSFNYTDRGELPAKGKKNDHLVDCIIYEMVTPGGPSKSMYTNEVVMRPSIVDKIFSDYDEREAREKGTTFLN